MTDPLLCIVEIPKGSRNKYEYDPDLGLMIFDRFLSASVVFPTDYGFIRGAYSADGDPMDVLITVSEPTFPGCAIHTKPVAVLWLCDQDEREPKVVCVPCGDPNWQSMDDLVDLPEQLVEEIAYFFLAYKRRESHEVTVDGWGGADEARRVVEEGFARGSNR
ncbi:MAG: inorganic diphosphatase [Pseudonocardiales bacterium]|nr:inorganic diphosphatase [Pseudonocardiales bacterium]MBV9030821.1 inorganic diphosphatase [Pseudonocardiales bacterium]